MAKKKRSVVYVAKSKTEAEHIAQGYRKQLKRDGLPYRGNVKIIKSGSNFSVVHVGDLPPGRSRKFFSFNYR